MAKSVTMRVCSTPGCGDEYPIGLFAAHRLVAHKPKALDPDRPFKCRVCKDTYPASKVEQHRNSARHREAHLVQLSFDPIPLGEAYVRGDRVRDIMKAHPRLSPPELYLALRLLDIPLRGNREPDFYQVEQRDFLARVKGDRWHRVRRLRAQGKSWIEIENIVVS